MADGYNPRHILRLEYFMEIGIFIMVISLKEYALIICSHKSKIMFTLCVLNFKLPIYILSRERIR